MATLTRGMHSWMSGDLEVLKLERDRQEPGSLRHIMAEMEVAELQKYLAQVEIVSLKTYQGEEEPPSPKRRRMETRQFKGPAVEALPEAATVRMAAASCSGDGVFARGHVPAGSFSRLLAELREESIEQGITPEMAMEFYNRQIMDGWVAAPLSPADCSPVDRLTP